MKLKSPKKDTYFYKFKNELALFNKVDNHLEYWENYWNESKINRLIELASKGKMQEFELICFKYIKKNMRILEAGCGPAHIVYGLHKAGYDIFGIDYEKEVVKLVNERLPELEIYEDNVLNLSLSDESIDAYLSFGVVEHFQDGPAKALEEAYRVLKPKGIAMITIPYLNNCRLDFSDKFVQNMNTNANLNFHQFYYHPQNFINTLEKIGFRLEETFPYACEAFLIREHPFFSRLWNCGLLRESIKKPLRNFFYYSPKWLRNRYGHMIMFFCRKV